jgi:DNA-binding NarL/FixJ family response regulator
MIRVLIADETERGCGGLLPRLKDAEGIAVVGQARDGSEALALSRSLRPDVLLLSSHVPGMDGLEVTRQVKAEGVAGAVLILADGVDEEWSRDAIRTGAAGVLPREIARDDLLQAIRSAARGTPAYAPAAPESPVGRMDAQASPEEPFRGLTDREREVLALVAEGYSNKEIAARLGLTVGTVKGYVSAILSKLGVADRTQAAVYALRHGLVSPDI